MDATLSHEIEKANFRNYILEITWFGLATAGTSRFLSIYAIRVGATPIDLGWMSSLPFIVLLLSTMLTQWWRSQFRRPMSSYHVPSIGFRLAFLLPVFTPLFPLSLQPLWLIASLALPALLQGVSSAIFVAMMREAVSSEKLTALASKRMMWMSVMVGIGALVFGFWLEHVPFPTNYQIMFVISFVLALVSHYYVTKVKLPDAVTNVVKYHSDAQPMRSPVYRLMIFCVVIAHVGYFAALPVIPLHLVKNLNAAEGFMAWFGIAEISGATLICLFTDRIIHRIGNRRTIAFGLMGSAVALLLLATPSLPLTLLGSAIAGAVWTAAAVAMFGSFVESTEGVSTQDMTRYTTTYHQMAYIAAFIGPMIGSNLANAGVSLVTVMLIGTLLRLLAGVAIFNVEYLFAIPVRRIREALHF